MKEEMYVKFKVTVEDETKELAGMIVQIGDSCVVKCHKLDSEVIAGNNKISDEYSIQIDDISRNKPRIDSSCLYYGKVYKIIYLYELLLENEFYKFIIESDGEYVIAHENEIIYDFLNITSNPITYLLNNKIGKYENYILRRKISELYYNFEGSNCLNKTMQNSRIEAYKHQLETVSKLLNHEKCRFLLADEVGMGKTIETIIYLKIKLFINPTNKILIILPKDLIKQWESELEKRFKLNSEILRENKNIVNYGIKSGINILSMDIFLNIYGRLSLDSRDLIVVDEIHKYLNTNTFKVLLDMSESVEEVLFLSATPIEKEDDEYLKLMKVMDPLKYRNMSREDFGEMLNKQDEIRLIIYNISADLNDYYRHNEVREDIHREIIKFCELTNDENVDKIIMNFGENKGEDFIKINNFISYAKEFYHIENRIICNRKSDLKIPFAKRECVLIPIQLVNQKLIYEYLMKKFKKYFDEIENEIKKKECLGIFKKLLIGLFNSISNFKKEIDENRIILNEIVDCEYLGNLIKKWKINLELLDTSEKYKYSKLFSILKYILANENNEKILVISDHAESVEFLYKQAKKNLGEFAVSRYLSYLGDTYKREQLYKFSHDSECFLLFADKCITEGNNVHYADSIIQVDNEWSISKIEQRIGRLDRINRNKDKPVKSIVFYYGDTIEGDLVSIWNDSVNVYKKSISGLEFVLKKLDSIIDESLMSDLEYGLYTCREQMSEFINTMENAINEERYFNLNDGGLSYEDYEILNEMFEYEEEKYFESIIKWSKLVGFTVSRDNDSAKFGFNYLNLSKAVEKNFRALENKMNMVITERKDDYEFCGLYKRKEASNDLDNKFLAINDPRIKSIALNSIESNMERTTAFVIPWEKEGEGIIFTWKIGFEKKYLIEKNFPVMTYLNYQGYFKNNTISDVIFTEGDFNEEEIYFLNAKFSDAHMMSEFLDSKGYVENTELIIEDEFIRKLNYYYKKSENNIKEKIENNIKNYELETFFNNKRSLANANRFYLGINNKRNDIETDSELKTLKESIYKGYLNPVIELDSIAFVKLG